MKKYWVREVSKEKGLSSVFAPNLLQIAQCYNLGKLLGHFEEVT